MIWTLLGCYSVTCGPGTKLEHGECVAFDGETDTDADADADTDTDADTDADTAPTGDTAAEAPPAQISNWAASCDVNDDLVVTARVGTAATATLYILLTADGPYLWAEEHTPEVAASRVTLELETSAPIHELVENVTTVFGCNGHVDDGALTYLLRIYDQGGELDDCVSWGDDAPGILRGAYFDRLETRAAQPSRPEEITTDLCRFM